MLGIRLLVILSGCNSPDAMVDTVLDAVSHAARPFCLRFALPRGMEAVLGELPGEASGGAALQHTLLFYPEAEGLQGILPLLSDETHFLSLRGPHLFMEKWDRGLFSRLRKPRESNVLLTGFMSAHEGSIPAQAYLPALGPFRWENGVETISIIQGMPLVCAASPVKSMILNPQVVFGAVNFLHQAETQEQFLSIAAFVAGFSVYVLEKALLWPVHTQEPHWIQRPAQDELPNHYLKRFEQFAGFCFEKKHVGERGTVGMFSTEDCYPQRMPIKLLLRQKAVAMLARAKKRMPLMVTAYIDLPDALKPMQHYLLRFNYLKALRHLPLLLYAGGRQEHSLRMRFPNTFSYPDNALLPRSLLQEGMTPMQHFRRSVALLLIRSLRAFPGFSHYAWIDLDALAHPICPQAVPDFSPLMDERIHIATVNGAPDDSFLIVPRQHLKLLSREAQALSQVDAAIKRSLSGVAMMSRLIQKYPELFTLHPMPRKNLLFITGFDPQFLSEEHRSAIRDFLCHKDSMNFH